MQNAIKTHVAALQRLEFEASDRTKGLDTRTWPILLTEVRKVTAIIADPAALEDEKTLERCRNATTAYRKLCADAAGLLVEIIEKHAASEKPAYDRPRYATVIGACEKAMGLKPQKSVIRDNP